MLKKIFDVTDSDIQRGGVGIATNGITQAFFDALEIKHYDPELGLNL